MLKEKPFMATYLIDYENVKSEGIVTSNVPLSAT